MGWNIKVGISKSFKSDFTGLTLEKQKAIRESMQNFMRDWTLNSLDYEPVQGNVDGIWSIRSNLGDRAFLKPYKKEGVYLFLTVGDHDKARERAQRKQIDVNPYTGAIQIFEVPEEIQYMGLPPASQRNEPKRWPFEDISNEDLLQMGVPEALLGYVRGLDEKRFYASGDKLPEDTYEYLSLLVEGWTVEEVLEDVRQNSEDVQGDIAASLVSPASRETFWVVENEDELSEVLSQSWEDWMTFLHPAQRRIAEADFKGPARVLGAAGTGKTVIAMHRAKHLASQCGPDESVFFTTFTKNLPKDITKSLAKICTPEEFQKIDVINLDDWVGVFMQDSGIPYTLSYGKPLENLWKAACEGSPLGLAPKAFKNEWEKVVMPQKILSYEQYARADRKGCGLKLDAVQRKQAWEVFDRYISLMKEKKICDNDYAMTLCEDYISKKYGSTPLYRHIIVDEAQDFGDCAYRLLRAMAGKEHRNDIYITGDSRQSIYGREPVLSRCGINVAGKSETLKINYRTTEEIKAKAISVVDGIPFNDLDKGSLARDLSASLTHGLAPAQRSFATYDEEAEFIINEIKGLISAGIAPCDICVAARTDQAWMKHRKSLTEAGFKVWQIGTDAPGAEDRDTLRIATMHRIKGLEFKYVFLCSLNKGIVPPASYKYEYAKILDDVTVEKMVIGDRSLLYMAMTRAREGVYLTSYGTPSDLLPKQPDLVQ